jgi:hypothetical protein
MPSEVGSNYTAEVVPPWVRRLNRVHICFHDHRCKQSQFDAYHNFYLCWDYEKFSLLVVLLFSLFFSLLGHSLG